MKDFIRDFQSLEASSGIALLLAALLAMLLANSPWATSYEAWWTGSVSFWINDGLMTAFFLMIGIEIRYEMTEGALASRAKALLPAAAAAGGVVLPALIYAAFNADLEHLRGFAIPSATDIAFSLGVLALFGRRIPQSLRIFLMALAVIDDLVAIVLIATFYSGEIYWPALAAAAVGLWMLWMLSCLRNGFLWFYLLAGVLLWGSLLRAGIHPAIAGVLLGALLPLRLGKPLLRVINPWVVFGVMPLFAFANAGIPLAGLSPEQLMNPVTLGIACGLFFGKQFGIAGTTWLLTQSRHISLPAGAGWRQFYGVCLLAGIGFTMSLFIGTLAFSGHALQLDVRLGVLFGSTASMLAGAALLAL